jgi:hypothetical protein
MSADVNGRREPSVTRFVAMLAPGSPRMTRRRRRCMLVFIVEGEELPRGSRGERPRPFFVIEKAHRT